MKVYDILKENEILAENVALFAAALETALARGTMTAVPNLLQQFARTVVGKSADVATKDLAQAWVKVAEKSGMALDDAIALGSQRAASAGVDAAIISAAEREALLLARTAGVSGPLSGDFFKRFKTKTQQASGFYGSSLNQINFVLMSLGIVEPVAEAVQYITRAYEEHDKGNPEFQGPKLQYAVEYEIQQCVTKVVAIWLGNKITGGVFGANGIQRIAFVGGPKMATAFNTIGPAAQAAFKLWFMSDEGQKAFAEWIVGNSILPGGKFFKGLTDVASGVVKSGYDLIMRKLESDKAQQLPKPTADDVKKQQELENPPKRFDRFSGAPLT